MHIFDVASGQVVGEPIPHVHLMGGSMAWRDDGSGFWYTLIADPAGFQQQVWFRDLGGAADRLDFPDGVADELIAENVLSTSPDGRWLMDRVQKGDGGEWQIFLRRQESDGEWWRLADIPDNCPHAVLGADVVYLLSRRDAPHGRILRLPLTEGATVADADEVVPTSRLIIEDLVVTRRTVWVADMDGGPQQLRAFDLDGRPQPAPEIPPVSSVSSYSARLSKLGPDRIAWSCESFTEPPTWWVAADGEVPRLDGLDDHQSGRPVRLRGDARVRDVVGRHPGPAQHHRRARHPAGRLGAGAVDGVRRVCDLAGAEVQSRADAVARARRGRRGCEHPGRRRVRPGMAPRGPARHQAELLRRLHRVRGPPRRVRHHQRATCCRSSVVPTAAC